MTREMGASGCKRDGLNRLTSDGRSSGTTSWSYNPADELTGTTDSGANTTTTLGYDLAHELTSLVKKTGTTTNQNLSLSSNANGDRTQQTDSVSGSKTSYAYDQADRLTSYTKGSSTGTVSTPFGYAGQYTDSESGLQYLRARYYDPATAQFLAVDPLTDVTGEPYSYTASDPLNAVDPTGLCGVVPVIPCPSDVGAGIHNGLAAVGHAKDRVGSWLLGDRSPARAVATPVPTTARPAPTPTPCLFGTTTPSPTTAPHPTFVSMFAGYNPDATPTLTEQPRYQPAPVPVPTATLSPQCRVLLPDDDAHPDPNEPLIGPERVAGWASLFELFSRYGCP